MTIEQKNVIDFIGLDRLTEDVVLTISDHLDWSDTESHLEALSDKLNTYLSFILDGELDVIHPHYSGRRIRIDVLTKFQIPVEILPLLLSDVSGVSISYRHIQFPPE